MAAARELWFVLHGYRQLAGRFIRRFAALPGVGAERAVVAPEALSRFYIEREVGPHGASSRVGASWMTREDRVSEIRDYVAYLDRLAGAVAVGGRRVVVLGFSQGAETASRWVARGSIRPEELILWGGGLAVDLEGAETARALRGVSIRLVVGSDDRWAWKRAAESEAILRPLGLGAERLEYEGGHTIPAEVLRRHWPE